MKKQLLYLVLFTLFISLNTFAQVANQPSDYQVCDDEVQDGIVAFNLTFKDAEVIGTQNPIDFSVSYFESQMDADNNVNPLPSPYFNLSNPQTVYVRLESLSSGNFDTTTFNLIVEQAPVVFIPAALEHCDPDGDGFGVFTLTDADAEITGGAPGLIVTYHDTMSSALNNVNSLISPYNNIVSNIQTVFARVENINLGNNCASIVELVLIVNSSPIVPFNIPDNVICDDNADGFSQFDLGSIITPQVFINGQAPSDFTLTYYLTLTDADSGNNPLVNSSNFTNFTNPQTIYLRLQNNNSDCATAGEFDIVVNPLPLVTLESSYIVCNGETLVLDTGLTNTNFSYQWAKDGITLNSETSATLLVTMAGTYTIIVTDGVTSCSSIPVSTVVNFETCVDTDSDGVNDNDEDVNNNGNLDDDDTDMDNIPNYLDDDDDGDNVDTITEINIISTRMAQHPFVDTDNDMIENYLDDDDDGDLVLTVDEDYNNNGDPTDDDTDFSGTPDYLEDNVTLNVEVFNLNTEFSLYPNPATRILTIKLKTPSNEDTVVEIIDVQGKIILQHVISKFLNVSVENLKSGLYFVKLKANNKQIIKKLIIE